MSIGKFTTSIKSALSGGIRDLIRDTTNDDTFYIYVAYSDESAYPFADSDLSEEITDSDLVQVYRNIVTMHRVLPGGVTRVIPRKNWAKNKKYIGAYDTITTDSDFYVLSTEVVQGVPRQNVYKCLFAPDSVSTVPPTGISSTAFKTVDNHWWQYMYTITNSESILFLNNAFMPVPEKITSTDAQSITSGTARYDQLQAQNSSEVGGVWNIRINPDANDSDIKNFTTKTFIPLRLRDGTGESITQEFLGTASRQNDSDSNWQFEVNQPGKGYTALPVAYDDSDSDQIAYTIFKADIAPSEGHASNAPDELKAFNVMLTSRAIPESGDFRNIAQNDFSMIGVIKNPVDKNTQKIASEEYYTIAKKVELDSQSLLSDTEVFYKTGDSDYAGKPVASVGNTLYYLNVGKLEKNFTDSDAITSISHDNVISKKFADEIRFNSGQVLTVDYLQNALSRDEDQIESLNIILKF
jgi:hypothetical protein